MYSVIAVTVTYNDYDFCKRAIANLRTQSYPLYKIIVVDNFSSKENREKLKAEADELVDILWLPENKGGAGGFQAGCEKALKDYDCDWIWLMDADAFPDRFCLENLLGVSAEGVGCLCPVIFGDDLKEWQLYHHKKEGKLLYKDYTAYDKFDAIPDVSKIDANAFVGPLVSTSVMKELGVPNGELFIYGDDLEYTYRISRKYSVLLVKNAVIKHRDQPIHGVQSPRNWWKDYYEIRNRLLFIKQYSQNWLYALLSKILVKLRLYKQLIKNKQADYSKELKKIRRKLLISAYHDGKHGIIGRSVDPKEFIEEIAQYK